MTKEWEKPEDLRRRKPVLWLTMTALFMAMVVVLSMSALSIPVPGGHLYFNDVVIDTAAMLMDPLSAFIACGVGAFLGDLLFYPAPMFVSLITHGLQALVISLLCRKLRMKQPLACAIAVLAGAIVMVVGYTLGRAFVYSTPEYAICPCCCLARWEFRRRRSGRCSLTSSAAIWSMCCRRSSSRAWWRWWHGSSAGRISRCWHCCRSCLQKR